ncbi:MAG TPA: hypothetical protein VMQ62_07910, partial [Dongiaceae bacterium]|nr:hypothetical protein [Dongiaceae bacterium]
ERWRPDPKRLAEGARAAGVRLALHLALRQIETLFPGAAPAGLLAATAPGRLRRFVLARLRPEGPLEILPWSVGEGPRAILRPLLADTPGDAWGVSLAVLARRRGRRHAPPFDRPWEAVSDDTVPAGEGAAVD